MNLRTALLTVILLLTRDLVPEIIDSGPMQRFKNQITQPIDVKFQTEFVENDIWLQNFMEFVKVEEII